MFIYVFQRERERENKLGAEREGDRESQAGSMPSVQSPMQGSNPQTMRSWPELKSRVRGLTHWATQVPLLMVSFHEQQPLIFFPKILFKFSLFNIQCNIGFRSKKPFIWWGLFYQVFLLINAVLVFCEKNLCLLHVCKVILLCFLFFFFLTSLSPCLWSYNNIQYQFKVCNIMTICICCEMITTNKLLSITSHSGNCFSCDENF